MTVPEHMRGIWRRDSIVLADGTEDRITRVFWAQASQNFIDIRINQDRSQCRLEDLPDLPLSDLMALARQKGFAGWAESDGSLMTWHRTIDYRPPNGRPDTALVRIVGSKLYEQGDADAVIGVDYQEEYTRLDSGEGGCLALNLDGCVGRPFGAAEPFAAMLILIGGRFFFARSRSAALPMAESLEELVQQARSHQTHMLEHLLGCEVSTGDMALRAPWIISLSTHPWREGQALFERPLVSRTANQITMTWPIGQARWNISECSIPADELDRLWS